MTEPKTPKQVSVMKDRLLTNIVTSPDMLSVRFVGMLTALWGVWSLIPETSQKGIVESLHIPTAWLPVFAAIGLYLTRVWPQPSLPATSPISTVPPTLTDIVPRAPSPVPAREPVADGEFADTEVVPPPAGISEENLRAAARALFPEMSEGAIARLANVARLDAARSAALAAARAEPNG